MYPLLGFAAVLLWMIAIIQMALAFWQVEPVIPSLFKNGDRTNGFAVDVYIWNRQIPDLARRRYVRTFVCFLLGAVLLAIGSFAAGHLRDAGLAAAASLGFGYATWKRWRQYRDFHRDGDVPRS